MDPLRGYKSLFFPHVEDMFAFFITTRHENGEQ